MKTKIRKIIDALFGSTIIVAAALWAIGFTYNSLKSIFVFIVAVLLGAVIDYYAWNVIFKKFIDRLKAKDAKNKRTIDQDKN